PDALADVVERAWALLRVVAIPQATAEDVVRAVHRAYVLIEELTAKELPTPPEGASEGSNQPLQPRAGEEQGGAYRPVETFPHRGVMDATRVRGPEGGVAPHGQPSPPGGSRARQAAPEGTEEFIGLVRRRYGGVVSLIRRYFEGIRPPGLRRMRRQADGEEVDIEAAVEALVERKAHVSASEFVYIRRDRRDRDVAAAFLVDLSGSTGQQIGPGGARIIEVEKEGLVLLCEALEAIGDQYAVYGYSGQSRHDVQILVLKDFDERYGPSVWRRIDAVRPLVQNRDGAAIRHALRRLSERAAKVKLLVMLSDGRPLDDA